PIVGRTSEQMSAKWCSPRALLSGRSASLVSRSCLIRSRSASIAARSIAVTWSSSDPEEAVKESMPELAVAVHGSGVHPAVRREHEAGRVELDHRRHVRDAVRAGGEPVGP